MTAITQHIPNFSHGISQQPDYLKRPGQVRDMLNAMPDVTQGLLKRPGGRRISSLQTTTGGKWFTIYRDDQEKYIVQYKDGLFKIWSLIDGLPRVVRYTDKPDGNYPKPGDGENTANPGLGSCDPVAFSKSIDDYRVAKQNADAIRNQINQLQAQIDHVTSGSGRKLFYNAKKKSSDKYEVITGHVVIPKKNSAINREEKFDINKPTQVQVNEKVIVGKRRLRDVYVSSLPVPPGSIHYSTYKCDVYEYEIVPKSVGSDPAEALRNQIDALKTQLTPLEATESQKREAYETMALGCGVTSSPYARSAAPTVPDYLADATPQDIEVLTVNDYTFITNRMREVVMGKDTSKVRGNEAFINIDTLAYNTEYAVDLNWDGDTTPSPINNVTKLSVSPTSWEKSDKGSGGHTDTKTFTIDQGAGSNLRFTLETRGQQLPVSRSDASKGYYTKYRTTYTLVNGGSGWAKGDKIKVNMAGKEYTVKVEKVSTDTVFASAGSGAALTAGDSTKGTLSVKTLLNELKAEIEKNSFGITATPIGSGLYLTAPKSFTVSVRASSYAHGFTDEVNDISKLPLECKDGYIVKVVNSGEKEDDYYVEFKGKSGNDGAGVWQETLKPGIETNFAYSSMPHQLKRLEDGTFQFSPVDWEYRLVGDNTSNPIPSFVGKTINKMFFFRNRLGFLTDENVVLSRAGDYFNFWAKTALTVQPSDPVDISASSTYPAILFDAVPFMQGVILFSATQQFILTTDQDIFGPETAKMVLMSTFRYSTEIKPFNMGTTIGFVNRSGRYARFMEMSGISRDRPPDLIEQSKIVPELIPRSVNCVADSRENDVVIFGSNASSTNQSSLVYGYRYFNDGERRIQSAWFRWDLAGKLEHHAVLEDSYFSVTLHNTINGPKLWLMRYDLTVRDTTGFTDGSAYINDEQGTAYPVCLDNYVVANVTNFQFYPHLNETYFHLPWSHDESNRVVAFDIGNSKFQGRMIYPDIVTDALGTWCVLSGDWSSSRLALGFDYEMQVTLPHLYVQKEDATANKVTSDTRSTLIISRVKFEFGESGTFKTIIKRKGRPDYVQEWETRPSDEYNADTHSVAPERVLEVPIYDRNTNVYIELYSTHPTPATLFAMDWEGNYSPMFYKRV